MSPRRASPRSTRRRRGAGARDAVSRNACGVTPGGAAGAGGNVLERKKIELARALAEARAFFVRETRVVRKRQTTVVRGRLRVVRRGPQQVGAAVPHHAPQKRAERAPRLFALLESHRREKHGQRALEEGHRGESARAARAERRLARSARRARLARDGAAAEHRTRARPVADDDRTRRRASPRRHPRGIAPRRPRHRRAAGAFRTTRVTAVLLCPSATSDEEQLRSKSREESSTDASPDDDALTYSSFASARNANASSASHSRRRNDTSQADAPRAARGFPRDARRVARATERVGGRELDAIVNVVVGVSARSKASPASGSIPSGRSLTSRTCKARFQSRRRARGPERREARGFASARGWKRFRCQVWVRRKSRRGARAVRSSGAHAAATAARADRDCARRPGRASREWPRSRRRRRRGGRPLPRAARRTPPTRPRRRVCRSTRRKPVSVPVPVRPLRVSVVREHAAQAARLRRRRPEARKRSPRALEREVLGGTSPCSVRRARLWRGDEPGRGARGDAKLVQRCPRRGGRRQAPDVRRRHAPRQRRQGRRLVPPGAVSAAPPPTSGFFKSVPLACAGDFVAVGAVARGGIAGRARLGRPTRRRTNSAGRQPPRATRTAARGRGSYRAAGASNRGDDAVRDANANVSALTTRAISASASARASPGAGVAGPLGRRERRRRRRGLRDGRGWSSGPDPPERVSPSLTSRGGTKPTRRVQRRAPRDEREHEPAHAARVHRLAHRLPASSADGSAASRRRDARTETPAAGRCPVVVSFRAAPGTSASSPVARGALKSASRAAPRQSATHLASSKTRAAYASSGAERSKPPSPRRPARGSAPARRRARAPRTPARPSRGSGRAREAAPAPATATATGSRIQTRIPPRRFREKTRGCRR